MTGTAFSLRTSATVSTVPVLLILFLLQAGCQSVPPADTGPDPSEVMLRVGPRVLTREDVDRIWAEARVALGGELPEEPDLVDLAILLLVPVEAGAISGEIEAQSRLLNRAAAVGWGGVPPAEQGREAVLAAIRRSDRTVYVVTAASAEEGPDGSPGEWVEVEGMRVRPGELEPEVARALSGAAVGEVVGPFSSWGRLLRFTVVEIETPEDEELVDAVEAARREIFADWAAGALPAIRRALAGRTVIRPAKVGAAVRRELGVTAPPVPLASERGEGDEEVELPGGIVEILDRVLAESGEAPFDSVEVSLLRRRVLVDLRRAGWPEARVRATGDPERPLAVTDPGRCYTLNTILFEGLEPAEEREARAKLPLEDGNLLAEEPYDGEAVRRAAAALRRRYREAGYSGAEVDIEVSFDEPPLRRTLRRLFTYPWENLATGRDALDPLGDGLLSVFLAPASAVGFKEPERQMTVTFVVRRGPAFHFREVRIRDDGEAPLATELRERAGAIEGTVAAEETVASLREEIVAGLRREGLSGSAIETTWVPLPDRPEWDVELRIRPGRPMTVRSVTFAGADETDEDVLREYVSARPGEPLDEARLTDDLAALRATGFVTSVRPEFRIREDEVDLVIHVEDRLGGQITPQGGIDFEGRPAAGLIFGLENFRVAGLLTPWEGAPVGAGERLGILGTWNAVERSAELLWEDPRAISEDADLRFRLAGFLRRLEPLDWDRLEGELVAPIDLGSGFTLSPGIGAGLDRYSDLDPALPAGVRSYAGRTERVGPVVSAAFREGEEGFTLRRRSGLMRVFGDEPVWVLSSVSRAGYDTELSDLLGERLARPFLHLRAGFDSVRAITSDGPLAWGDLLRAGGPGTLRGFEPNGIGPTYRPGEHLGGEGRFLGGASVELRLPDSGGMRIALEPFVDLAAVGGLDGIRDYLRPSISAGVTLTLAIPDIGLALGLHFGRPLRREPEDEVEALQLSLDMVR